MKKETMEKLEALTKKTEPLIRETDSLAELCLTEASERLGNLIENKEYKNNAKLFLEFKIASDTETHVRNAHMHIIDAKRELEKAANIRSGLLRGLNT